MLTERFEISGDDDLDLRSEDEKARAAVTNWMRWQGYLGHLDRWQQAAIWGAVREQTALIRDRQATDEGRGYVQALRKLSALTGVPSLFSRPSIRLAFWMKLRVRLRTHNQ
ncbi:hypothetical protein JMM61_13290 [Rhodovulum sulfidophilum]|uniref:hypothetical protein n=1 Tax=Rhodovulum sulfidophilum TaxID=35806 RepID=UPI001925945E|nr:hypothetical protein [Rhodovulum sulfidophilum]MBL3586352.1 hypothetical protein [Rhodovulum sulfidophilum]